MEHYVSHHNELLSVYPLFIWSAVLQLYVCAMCALTLLLMDSMLSFMVSMASDMRFGRERTTLSTPDGPSKRSATCIIVSAETGDGVSSKHA